MPATCARCGEAVEDAATTCPHCGREIAAPTTAPIEPASAQPIASQPVPPAMPVVPSVPPPAGGGLAVAALVIGIVAIVLSFTIVFGFVLGGLAIVFGAIALARARTPGTGGKGMGVAGLVLGIVAIFFAVLTIVFVVNLGHAVNDNFSNVPFCIDHPHDPSCRDPRVP